MRDTNPNLIGKTLRARATHHDHGEGWVYSRDIGDLVHIRFKSDTTGYDHWTKRYARALDPKGLLGIDKISKMIWGDEPRNRSIKDIALEAWAYFYVNSRVDTNLPDGRIHGNITFWEEDGEYIEMVGPTVGEKIAEFLIREPENPHAIAIAEEIQRILSLHK